MNYAAVLATLTMTALGVQPNSAVRKIDIKAQIEKMNPSLRDCASPGRSKVDIEFIKYADVDGDGTEEIIVVGRTCYSGTGGPDIYDVFRLVGINQLKNISPSNMIRSFKGKPIFPKDGNWIVDLDFENGYLIESFTDSRYNNGTIKLFFKWVHSKFKLIRVEKSPA